MTKIKFLFLLLFVILKTQLFSQSHFTPVWSGSPYQTMNIFLESATYSGNQLSSGDEVAAYDGDVCVGAIKLTGAVTSYTEIKTSADNPLTTQVDGFISGHAITYKLWKASSLTEISSVTTTYNPASPIPMFTALGTAFVNLQFTAPSQTILNVSPDYQSVTFVAGTTTFTVSNAGNGAMNWTAASNTSWLTITSGSSGTNTGTINVSYTTNSGAARTGTITITASGAQGSPKTVEVRQAPVGSSIKPITSNTTISKGTDFWVEVKVGDPNTVTDLYGISFKLSSNNSNCTYKDGSAEKGDFLGSSTLFYPQRINNQTVDIGITKISGSGASGSGIVARAKFTPSTSISSDQTVVFSLSDIVASNSTGGTILFSASSLTITINSTDFINVWPGDCNNDNTVTSADVIPIGLYYGQTRPGSNNPGSSWQAYLREPWASDSGIPRRIYADSNGDGTINSADIIPIGLNYGKVHTSIQVIDNEEVIALQKTNADATIKPIITSPVTNNTVFQVQVKIGDPNIVQNLYGTSFKLQSNKPACIYIDDSAENAGFLGTGSSVLFFSQEVNNQAVDIGISKTSGSGVSGSGILARAQFISSIDQIVTFSLIDVVAVDHNGNSIPLSILPSDVSVDVIKQNAIPTEFLLYQNFPNPFNPTTIIKYELSKRSSVKIILYDLLGREIKTLVNEEKEAGHHEVTFVAKDLSSGIYFYRMQAGDFIQTKRMILLK